MRKVLVMLVLLLILFISGCTTSIQREVSIQPAKSSDVILPDLEKDIGELNKEKYSDDQNKFLVEILNKMVENLK